MSFDAVTAVLVIPAGAAALLVLLPDYRLTARLNIVASLTTFLAALSLFVTRPEAGRYLLVDDLNNTFIVLTTFVGFTTSAFSASYIGHELHTGRLTPTYLRFYHAMYQTLTRGFGLMAPQAWMAPQQKYDVIHYIREAYLRPDNASQFAAITGDYLAGLPKGDTFGPPPRTIEPWVTVDYGPSLIHTYEFGAGGSNIAQKGIAVRLDAGAGGVSRGRAWMVFEHDTLRWAGGWTAKDTAGNSFIDWNGIQFNGKHQVHPRVVGEVHFQNPTGPGWADPETGSLADEQRVVGRDGKRYGPLPRSCRADARASSVR